MSSATRSPQVVAIEARIAAMFEDSAEFVARLTEHVAGVRRAAIQMSSGSDLERAAAECYLLIVDVAEFAVIDLARGVADARQPASVARIVDMLIGDGLPDEKAARLRAALAPMKEMLPRMGSDLASVGGSLRGTAGDEGNAT